MSLFLKTKPSVAFINDFHVTWLLGTFRLRLIVPINNSWHVHRHGRFASCLLPTVVTASSWNQRRLLVPPLNQLRATDARNSHFKAHKNANTVPEQKSDVTHLIFRTASFTDWWLRFLHLRYILCNCNPELPARTLDVTVNKIHAITATGIKDRFFRDAIRYDLWFKYCA